MFSWMVRGSWRADGVTPPIVLFVDAARARGANRLSSGSSQIWWAARMRWTKVFVITGGGGVLRSISSATQSSSTDVLRQLLDNSGAATQGMPASSTLSNAFSSTLRQATPTMASTWPLTMIFRTMGVPSETSTLYP